MSVPVPAPRRFTIPNNESKKPVPIPRKSAQIKKSESQSPTAQSTNLKPSLDDHTNTFSRRVRSLSNVSKQLAEDLGELVNDKKKAVIEGTRQSVRRITRRFNNNSNNGSDQSSETSTSSIKDNDKDTDNFNIFNSISFQSPISTMTKQQRIYNNVDDTITDDYFNAPPPNHPPPPLPEGTLYDAPLSVTSLSTDSTDSNITNNCNNQTNDNYECVFPSYTYDSDSEGYIDMTSGTLDNHVNLSRSGSWKFYDVVNKNSNDGDNNESIKSNLNDCDSVEIRNSVYENHNLLINSNNDNINKVKRPSESVILQFDPLSINDSTVQASSKEFQLLEELLQGDLFGNLSSIHTLDNWSISNDSDVYDEFLNPPPPPVRTDSLPEEEQIIPSSLSPSSSPSPSPSIKTRSNWFTSNNDPSTSSTNKLLESRKSGWLKQVKEVLEKTGRNNKDHVVQRPELAIKNFVYKKGMLYKVQGGPVEDLFGEYSGRWCILQRSNFICYADNTCETIRENFSPDTILSIQILQDPKYKYKYDNEDLHCFELNTSGKSRGGHIYGSRDVSERRIWMQNIAESLTNRFSTKITTDYTRMGWAYIREGVSGKWLGAWLILSYRTLYYALDDQPVKSMDLRKVRCIVLQVYSENDHNPRTNDKGPNIVVDSTTVTLYIRMWTSRETKVWCHIVKGAAHNNGPNLDQQQLTKNNVPVIVEKCINFIYVHGSMTEGIYRRSGVGSAVTDLLAKFRKDAWAVQLTDKFTEHDVATALKRFFRDLPEPLLSSKQRQYLYQVSLVNNQDERVRMYKAAFDHLPPISFTTAKKLISHLHFISTQCSKNLMNVENLAAIWGPTLMCTDDKDNLPKTGHQQDRIVVRQLIELYQFIFSEDPEELEQERLMLQVLEKYNKCPQGAAINDKKAGEFRVWIYLDDKDGKTFNVAIGPNRTSYDICVELSSKISLPSHQLILEEVVLNDKLVRPIHHSEKVLDVVLRWGYWDEPDRKNNHLILTRLSKYLDFIQENLLPVVSGELKFADSKSKTFKIYMFEFSQAKLTYFKEKTCENKMKTWNIENIIWYLGHEEKRNPQSRWTITFIETTVQPKRTKNTPYFGNILAWNDPTTRANWLASMLKARYPDSLTNPVLPVNLLYS